MSSLLIDGTGIELNNVGDKIEITNTISNLQQVYNGATNILVGSGV